MPLVSFVEMSAMLAGVRLSYMCLAVKLLISSTCWFTIARCLYNF